jgi:RNA polymerase sigma-70 factor, ECF subfamily
MYISSRIPNRDPRFLEMPPERLEITELLRRWGEGDAAALNQLMPLVYERMHELAHRRRRREPDASLNTTALVHEAYLRLVDAPRISVRDRGHFLALASRVMRHLLVDQARARKTAKRGGGAIAVPLDEAIWVDDADLDVIAGLESALGQLEAVDARQAQILELRYFGGLSLEETAGALDVSLATVKRELRSARAWLAATLTRESV